MHTGFCRNKRSTDTNAVVGQIRIVEVSDEKHEVELEDLILNVYCGNHNIIH